MFVGIGLIRACFHSSSACMPSYDPFNLSSFSFEFGSVHEMPDSESSFLLRVSFRHPLLKCGLSSKCWHNPFSVVLKYCRHQRIPCRPRILSLSLLLCHRHIPLCVSSQNVSFASPLSPWLFPWYYKRLYISSYSLLFVSPLSPWYRKSHHFIRGNVRLCHHCPRGIVRGKSCLRCQNTNVCGKGGKKVPNQVWCVMFPMDVCPASSVALPLLLYAMY